MRDIHTEIMKPSNYFNLVCFFLLLSLMCKNFPKYLYKIYCYIALKYHINQFSKNKVSFNLNNLDHLGMANEL